MAKTSKKQPLYKRKAFLWSVGIVVGLVIIILTAFRLSPWPGALIIRADFEKNDKKLLQQLQKHIPSAPITIISNEQYAAESSDTLLDVYYPREITGALPVVIWTHGGAWLSGDKENVAPYFKLLSEKGFTVISLNYTLAPEKTYPAAIFQLNEAYRYIQANATRFHADTNSVVLAGDSAGANLSAQMAALITNPAYAKEVGMSPNFAPAQLKGVVLNCGIYKMEALTQPDPTLPKIVGWGSDVSVWAYSGTRDFSAPIIKQMSPYYYVTQDFPPTFITGGNNDPLTDVQSKPLAHHLQSLGVPVTPLFYPANHQPGLPHEYQFNLDIADGRTALNTITTFIKTHTKNSVYTEKSKASMTKSSS